MKPVLLLDLGGVLADLGDPVRALRLEMTLSEFWKAWTSSASVRAFETGQMTEAEFLVRIAVELGYAGTTPFMRQFHAWRLRLFPGVEDLLRDAALRYRVALLSNTNTIHWGQVNPGNKLSAKFAQTFLSFETGHFKPSPAAFEQVIAYFDCPPAEIVFLDDSEPNVAAASALGIDARRVVGVTELRRQLPGVADRN